MIDKLTGQSLGYGFVKFKETANASAAIKELSGKALEDKILRVGYARPPAAQVQQGNLYISNIPTSMTKEQLEQIFSPYGKVVDSKILVDKSTNTSRGVGFVKFDQKTEAENAIYALNGTTLPGMMQAMKVKFADSSEDKQRKKSRMMMPSGMAMRAPLVAHVPASTPYGQYAATNDYYNQMAAASYYQQAAAAYSPAPAAAAAYAQQAALQQQVAMGFAPSVPGANPCVFVYNLPPDADEALVYRLFGSFGGIASVKLVRDPKTSLCKGFAFVNYTRVEDATAAITAMNGATYKGKPLQVSFKKL